jgi:SNF2 family DNA or RNA helicase
MRVLVISYDLMDRVRDRLQKENKGAGFQVIIADECHMLKNQNTKRSKAILPMLKVRSSD